jgi:hypothetical protein
MRLRHALPVPCPGVDHLDFSADGRSLLARIRVGRGPHGLCVYPQPGRYPLGHTGVFR